MTHPDLPAVDIPQSQHQSISFPEVLVHKLHYLPQFLANPKTQQTMVFELFKYYTSTKKKIQKIDSQAAYHPPSKRKKDKFCRVVCREQNAENTWMLERKTSTWVPARKHPHAMMMMPKREIYRAHGMP
jgi:hypothetical protein